MREPELVVPQVEEEEEAASPSKEEAPLPKLPSAEEERQPPPRQYTELDRSVVRAIHKKQGMVLYYLSEDNMEMFFSFFLSVFFFPGYLQSCSK